MNASPLILTVHLGGNHITVAVYDTAANCLIPGSYLRVPVSHKAKQLTILNIWRDTVAEVVGKAGAPISGCSLIVPACFDPAKLTNLPKGYNRYVTLQGFDVAGFFAECLRLSQADVKLFSHAEAMLRGEIDDFGKTATTVYGITIGTDLGGAVAKNNAQDIADLNWEFAPFLNGYANNFLSSEWLQAFYYEATGISVLNVEQMISLYRSGNAVKVIIKMFADNFQDFLQAHTTVKPGDIFLIEGDIVLAGSHFLSRLKKAFPSAVFKLVEPGKKSSLVGGGLLFGALTIMDQGINITN
jgi:glucokinase